MGAEIGPAEITAAGVALGAAKQLPGMLDRVLGPSLDKIGSDLAAHYSEYRVRNLLRVAEKAVRKQQQTGRSGEVPPRVAHRLIEDGSYCDDEVVAEYLGGVLAGSKSPDGRDDRGVAWAALIADMSSQQIRAHFLLYRQWHRLLREREDLNLAVDAGRNQVVMHVDLIEFVTVISQHTPEPVDLSHVIPGLCRLSLLGTEYSYGPRAAMPKAHHELDLQVNITIAGIELYGWSLSRPSLISFAGLDEEPTTDPSYDGLQSAILPSLPPRPCKEGPDSPA